MKPLGADMFSEIVVDSFAGGGGASVGLERALGRAVDVAINHDTDAILMHAANHPNTRHELEDVWKVDPHAATGDRPVGLLWASPDCKHFSRAKGAKPVEKRIRSLAWVVVKWAREVAPRVIILENVREFQEWGPLGADSRPIAGRKGETFNRWVNALRTLGYVVEWRALNAADYGAPTHRRRLFIVARRDGQPIVWPERTHGEAREVQAARPVRSGVVRETAVGGGGSGQEHSGRAEAVHGHGHLPRAESAGRRSGSHHDGTSERVGLPPAQGGGARALRPYRTAAECIDWSIPCPSIFLTKEEGRAIGVKRPLADKTLRRIAAGVRRFVIESGDPFIVPVTHSADGDGRCRSIHRPMPTLTTAKGGEHALVTPFIAQHFGGMVGKRLDEPLPTVTAIDHNSLVAAFLTKYHHATGAEHRCNSPAEPLRTLDTQNRFGLAAAFLSKFYGTAVGQDAREPMPTVTADGQHVAQVRAFLIKYYGQGVGQPVSEGLHTVTTKERFGLVTVAGVEYEIVDIGLRMLTPRELARAQGFPDTYTLTGTKTSQIARIGNSVCPVMAEALARANYTAPVHGAGRAVA